MIHEVLWELELKRGDNVRGSRSGWLVVKSVALTVQLLAGFNGRCDIETTLPFGALIIDVYCDPKI